VGFFQVVNHGVPEGLLAEMLAAVRSFIEEPAEAKAPYYTRDFGRRVRYQSNFDLFQSPAANWRDSLYMEMAPDPPAPEEIPPACRGVVTDYTKSVRTLGDTVLELLSEALGLHRGYLEHATGGLEGLKITAHYYPACPEPHLTMGTTRHSDPSFFTVLLQDGIGGLQVIVEDEKLQPIWVDVPFVAGALIVNIGDFLQLISNDRFKSVEHRVVSKSVGPRVSVACFFQSHGAAVYSPIIPEGDPSPQLYRSTTVEEMLQHFREKGLDGSSTLQHFRI
jgi:isopenicillin N synthase-like dioxygenase